MRLPSLPATHVAAAIILTSSVMSTSPAQAGEYLPRLLYPGTYGNFCGPTPEFPRGWRGDAPIDAVDRACQTHDAAYESCAQALRGRQGPRAVPKLLSVLTALRSSGVTAPILRSIGVDDAYLSCSHVADQGLIRDGLTVRGASQRAACVGDGYEFPKWFCDLKSLTLMRIEQVDFDLFLSDLDWDDAAAATLREPGLKFLEAERRATLRRAASREPLTKAWESVRDIEAAMYERLK